MDAIKLLTEQHREVEELFEKFEKAGENAMKKKLDLCRRIADALAVHATIEEKIFYPATKDARTEELLQEAVEEHLAAKRIIADVVEENFDGDEELAAKMSVLKEQVEHHVEEEEEELFPKVKKARSQEELEDMGQRMQQMSDELESEGEPAQSISAQIDAPSHI